MSRKYSELSVEAQKVAQAEYQKGWNETHPDETFTAEELHYLCLDCDIYLDYNLDGTIYGGEDNVR